MPQLNKGDTFADGQQVTGARLNQLVDSATLNAGAITLQPSVATNSLVLTDYVLVTQGGVLSKATVTDLLTSTGYGSLSLPNVGQINGTILTQALVIGSDAYPCNTINKGFFTASSCSTTGGYNNSFNLYASTNGAVLDCFSCTYTGLFTVPYADARFLNSLTIPSGATSARSSTAVTGNTRFNTDTNSLETYNGSQWQTASNIYAVVIDSPVFSDYDANVSGRYTFSGQWYSTTGYTMYSETFIVPTGEKWEIEYNCNVGYGTNDGFCGVWLVDGVSNYFYSGIASSNNPVIFTGVTSPVMWTSVPISASFVLTAGTHTITYKVGIFQGTGSDAIYSSKGNNVKTVRKYRGI